MQRHLSYPLTLRERKAEAYPTVLINTEGESAFIMVEHLTNKQQADALRIHDILLAHYLFYEMPFTKKNPETNT